MSYRFRFAEADKKYINKIRNMNSDELVRITKKNYPEGYSDPDGEGAYFHVYDAFGQEEIYDMGDCPYAMDIINVSEKLFTNPETDKWFEESNLYICTKEAFLAAIEGMRKLNQKYYQSLIDHPATVALFLEEKKREWSEFTEVMELDIPEEKKKKLNETYFPYSLDTSVPDIVTSWRYEYAIFEMVRIYKAFDWDKHALLFYGW